MPARTGEQFLQGLKGARDIWVDGARVDDVVDHPALAGAARALADVYDLQHDAADICLMPDPETGEPISVSHIIPASRADLQRRHKCLERIAEFSAGMMGRTPDYLNVTYAGFAGGAAEWGAHGNEQGAERLVAYQKMLRRADLSLTHTIVPASADKAQGDSPFADDQVNLHKVEDTEHGIVVRGARVLATLGAVRRRARDLSPHAAAGRRGALCACLLRADVGAGAEIHLPRQRVGERQPV